MHIAHNARNANLNRKGLHRWVRVSNTGQGCPDKGTGHLQIHVLSALECPIYTLYNDVLSLFFGPTLK